MSRPCTQSRGVDERVQNLQGCMSIRSPKSPPKKSFTTISVLELAEILDQHRIWVESAGESGAKPTSAA